MKVGDERPVLDVVDLTKRFGGLTAVDAVSFGVPEGEILGLIGPNGSGKSTLFNCIMSKYAVTAGSVVYRGEDITGLPTHEIVNRGIAIMNQESNPIESMTVRENIELYRLPNSIFGARTALDDAGTVDIASIFALEDKIDRTADSLNHVDVRRLELAKAMATNPEFLLIDEPFAGLNRSESKLVAEQIRSVHQHRSSSMIIVDHNVQDLLDLVSRVVVLNKGEKLAAGSPENIVASEAVQEAYFGGEVSADE